MAAFGSFALLNRVGAGSYTTCWQERWRCGCWLPGSRRGFLLSGWRIRRGGLASPGFAAVTAAAFALIWSVFTNDFSITYIMEHSNRALPGGVQVLRAVERAGRFAAAVGVAAGRHMGLCCG